uniref:Uncharacterized protein n=1 Tax=Kwoniella bestiolae CBS 10118 TaxID=1296100 RepID=A0A1B9FST6_9TREE|nr:hypothetical protein I302_08607 [Kwoniella bestiolae CBS 10118]OCF21828.1 hypothetical protein I302_08607 [Kwoniella bestiolae CBS 10118]
MLKRWGRVSKGLVNLSSSRPTNARSLADNDGHNSDTLKCLVANVDRDVGG